MISGWSADLYAAIGNWGRPIDFWKYEVALDAAHLPGKEGGELRRSVRGHVLVGGSAPAALVSLFGAGATRGTAERRLDGFYRIPVRDLGIYGPRG